MIESRQRVDHRTRTTGVLVATALLLLGCSTPELDIPEGESSTASDAANRAATPGGGHGDGVAGISWKAPAGWSKGETRPMRVATYFTSGDEGTRGECAVFYFGANQGGAVDANIARWAGQFETPDGGTPKAETGEMSVGNLKVTTVEIQGTYNQSAAMSGQSTRLPDHMLLGAIVEGPQGMVFFKFTAPKATAETERGAFEQLLKSME